MKDWLKLFLLFQLLPATMLFFLIGAVALGVTFSYQAQGASEAPFMTDWERDPGLIINQFWQGMEFVVFLFSLGFLSCCFSYFSPFPEPVS